MTGGGDSSSGVFLSKTFFYLALLSVLLVIGTRVSLSPWSFPPLLSFFFFLSLNMCQLSSSLVLSSSCLSLHLIILALSSLSLPTSTPRFPFHSSFLSFCKANAIYVGYAFSQSERVGFVWTVKLLRSVATLFVTFTYIPILKLFIRALACRDSSLLGECESASVITLRVFTSMMTRERESQRDKTKE